jgi:hypothetical protein
MEKENKFVCVLCGNIFTGFGNNPDGACWKDMNGNIVEGEFDPDARCCDECDNKYVIPGRIYLMQRYRKQNNN